MRKPLLLCYLSLSCMALASAPTNAQSPDLSLLTTQQKNEGVGQVQPSQPNVEEPDRPKRFRWIDSSSLIRRNYDTPVAMGAVGATGFGAAGYANSNRDSYDPRWWDQRSFQNDDNTSNGEPPLNPAITENNPDPGYLGYAATDGLKNPQKFEHGNRPFIIDIAANAVVVRDLYRFSAPINESVSSTRLGMTGATGFDASFGLLSKSDESYGLQFGGFYVSGSDRADADLVSFLYTNPQIGFSPHAMQSTRDSALRTFEANVVLPGYRKFPWSLGVRYLRFDDTLTNQVMPTGIFHQIQTHSNSALLQVTTQPGGDYRYFQVESLLQFGAGLFSADSTTDLDNVVSATPFPKHIVTDRINFTTFGQVRLGLALPLGNVGVLRSGVSAMAQHDLAQAAAQISHAELVNQKYHLRTEPLFIGSLYLGAEFKR